MSKNLKSLLGGVIAILGVFLVLMLLTEFAVCNRIGSCIDKCVKSGALDTIEKCEWTCTYGSHRR